MNLTLSVDEAVLPKARQVAKAMNKSLNQLIRDYLEQLVTGQNIKNDISELRRLSAQGQGRSKGWRFNREEIYEKSQLS
jgi:antitoxin component of RelBE/YafQ-DinJ toxin-antitoxin module